MDPRRGQQQQQHRWGHGGTGEDDDALVSNDIIVHDTLGLHTQEHTHTPSFIHHCDLHCLSPLQLLSHAQHCRAHSTVILIINVPTLATVVQVCTPVLNTYYPVLSNLSAETELFRKGGVLFVCVG